jgi:quinol monooxygenase YgiN
VSESQISMVLRIRVPAASREQIKAALLAVVEPSHREPGCLRYELYGDVDNEGDYILLESWRDQAAFDEHIAKPYLKDFTARFADVFRDAVTSGLTLLAAL